ncbi:YhcN/YlaJ family sporulation lipoprotein [Virgibacillus kimchii]
MVKRLILPCSLLLFFIAACTNAGEEETSMYADDNDVTEPIHYETEQERKDRLNVREPSIGERGGYPQSKQENVSDADFESEYTDLYTTDRTEEIADYLKRKQEIVQAQVAETDDRIVIGVLLPEHTNRDVEVSGSIEEEVRDILPGTNKQIIVITDDVYWDRMKNIDARWKARERGEDLGEMLEDYFNTGNNN